MFDGLVPYEVVDFKKKDFYYLRGQERLAQEVDLVALLPVEFGTVVRTENGWAQVFQGQVLVEFGKNEIVWKVKA